MAGELKVLVCNSGSPTIRPERQSLLCPLLARISKSVVVRMAVLGATRRICDEAFLWLTSSGNWTRNRTSGVTLDNGSAGGGWLRGRPGGWARRSCDSSRARVHRGRTAPVGRGRRGARRPHRLGGSGSGGGPYIGASTKGGDAGGPVPPPCFLDFHFH